MLLYYYQLFYKNFIIILIIYLSKIYELYYLNEKIKIINTRYKIYTYYI